MTTIGIYLAIWLSVFQVSFAENNLPKIKGFNQTCPAEKLCPKLRIEFHKCESKKTSEACGDFVKTYKALLPSFDCNRKKDIAPVPAIWMCNVIGLEKSLINEPSIRLLRELKFKSAKDLFESQELKATLDGSLWDEYRGDEDPN